MKKLLLAALVLAGLGGAIWWSEKQEAARKDLPDPKAPPKILSLQEADVTRMELQRTGEAPTVLVKGEDGKWSITMPELPADNAAISALAGTASNLSSDRVVDDNLTDLAMYGLEPPAISLALTMKDGKQHRLRLGAETPDGARVYASLDGDKRLFTLARAQRENFNKGARDFRDRRLLTFDADQIARVELMVTRQPTIEFSRGDDAWQILRPKPLRADGLQIDELLRQLKEAEMDTTATDAEAEAGFNKGASHATAKVTDADGTKTLELRKSGGEYFARSSVVKGVFKVTPSLGAALNKTLDDLENKKLFDFAFDDPSKLTLHFRDEEKTFEKNGTTWLANGRAMDSVGVQSLIDKLRDLSATAIDDARMGNAEIEITIVSKEGKRSERVELAPSGDTYLARRGAEAGVYHVDGSAIQTLQQAVKDVAEASKEDEKKK
jgi:hypothetical protein